MGVFSLCRCSLQEEGGVEVPAVSSVPEPDVGSSVTNPVGRVAVVLAGTLDYESVGEPGVVLSRYQAEAVAYLEFLLAPDGGGVAASHYVVAATVWLSSIHGEYQFREGNAGGEEER